MTSEPNMRGFIEDEPPDDRRDPFSPNSIHADEPEPPEWVAMKRAGGPTVSLAEAGAQSHLSVATIRRRLKAEQIPGAVRNADRSWSIPVASLVAEGIWTGTTAADDDDQDDAPSAPAPDLTAELVAMRHRAELAELERDQLRERVDDMRTAMRMLEAGPPRAPEPAPQPRRRWWQRKPIVAGASLTVGAAEAAEKVGWVMEHMPMPPAMSSPPDDVEPL